MVLASTIESRSTRSLCVFASEKKLKSRGLGERVDLDMITEVCELFDETVGLGLFRAAIEVVGAKILIEGPVFEHVIDGGEHRGGDGADRLLRPVAALEATE